MNKSLFTVFAEDRYPHQAAISLGGGQALKIRYRAAPKSQAQNVNEFLLARIAELGFPDPKVAFRAFAGVKPEGAESDAFEAACEALGETGGEKIAKAIALSEGYALSLLLGSWSLAEGKAQHEIDEPINAETCTALPDDVKRAIAALAANAQAPAEALDFFGQSPRS